MMMMMKLNDGDREKKTVYFLALDVTVDFIITKRVQFAETCAKLMVAKYNVSR